MTPLQALWVYPTTMVPWCITVKMLSAMAPSPPSSPRSPLSAMSLASVWSSVTVTCSSYTAFITAVRVNSQHLLCFIMCTRSAVSPFITAVITPYSLSCWLYGLAPEWMQYGNVWISKIFSIVRNQSVYSSSKSYTCVMCVNKMSSSPRLHVPGLVWLWTWEYLWYDPGTRG